MIESLKARFAIVAGVSVLAAVFLLPNFFPQGGAPLWPSKSRLVYGLDIQGGLHLVLEAGIDEIIQEHLFRAGQRIKEEAEEAGMKTFVSDSPPYYLELQIKNSRTLASIKKLLKRSDYATSFRVQEGEAPGAAPADPSSAPPFSDKPASGKPDSDKPETRLDASDKQAKLKEALKNKKGIPPVSDGGPSSDGTASGAASVLRLSFYETRLRDLKKKAVDQSIEVIRSRIDEFGVTEPNISAQGDSRILVQLPGVKDSQKAKDLIKRTAKLEFATVNEDFPPEKIFPLIKEAEEKGGWFLGKGGLPYREYIAKLNKTLRGRLPENHILAFEKAPGTLSFQAGGAVPYIIDKNTGLTGANLEDASVGFDPDTNQPETQFRFEPRGRKIFADLTGRIKGKRMAIILDGEVKSAPVVEERIPGGNTRIRLGSGDYDSLMEEANMIASALRSGALPASLKQLEERTVGPTLGKQSIEKGKTAGLIGLALVMLFMPIYYKSFGLIAAFSLAANILFLLALLSSLSATLTLPGIAGIILTVGMAVDANVIVFERIKEELRKGSGLKLSIREGFQHAFSAILDANITTAIVCAVLMYFGTGPVRGFAVTLFLGVLTSLFTAVFLSRTFLEALSLRRGSGWRPGLVAPAPGRSH